MATSSSDTIASRFHLPEAPRLSIRTLQRRDIALTELRGRAGHGLTDAMPRENAYLVALQFLPCANHDLFFEGRYVRPRNYRAGVTSFYDLRREPVADLRDPFHSLMMRLPLAALEDIDAGHGRRSVDRLACEDGLSVDDVVLRSLFTSLLPAVRRPEEASTLFLDHVVGAITAHIASRYGGPAPPATRARRGLAPWQERHVKALIDDNLDGNITVSRLAEACGLSIRHFGRAFRESVGLPPHRWLLKRRVTRAQDMLSRSRPSVAAVAVACGFVDQSHLTRVFKANVGLTPAQWRRQIRR